MSPASCVCHIVGQEVRAQAIPSFGEVPLPFSWAGVPAARVCRADKRRQTAQRRYISVHAPLSPVVTGTPLYRYSGKQRRHCRASLLSSGLATRQRTGHATRFRRFRTLVSRVVKPNVVHSTHALRPVTDTSPQYSVAAGNTSAAAAW